MSMLSRLHLRVAHRLEMHVGRQERGRRGVANHDEADARVVGHRLQRERQPRRQLACSATARSAYGQGWYAHSVRARGEPAALCLRCVRYAGGRYAWPVRVAPGRTGQHSSWPKNTVKTASCRVGSSGASGGRDMFALAAVGGGNGVTKNEEALASKFRPFKHPYGNSCLYIQRRKNWSGLRTRTRNCV